MPIASTIIFAIDKAVIRQNGTTTLQCWVNVAVDFDLRASNVSAGGGNVWYEMPYEPLSEECPRAWRLWSIDLPIDAER